MLEFQNRCLRRRAVAAERDRRDDDDTIVPGRRAARDGAGSDSPPVAPAADDGVLDGRAGQGPSMKDVRNEGVGGVKPKADKVREVACI